jgi:hypothetical protein
MRTARPNLIVGNPSCTIRSCNFGRLRCSILQTSAILNNGCIGSWECTFLCVLRSDCFMNISFSTCGLFHTFSTKPFICSTQWKKVCFCSNREKTNLQTCKAHAEVSCRLASQAFSDYFHILQVSTCKPAKLMHYFLLKRSDGSGLRGKSDRNCCHCSSVSLPNFSGRG